MKLISDKQWWARDFYKIAALLSFHYNKRYLPFNPLSIFNCTVIALLQIPFTAVLNVIKLLQFT
jgi:hypothetical protein